MPKTVNKLSEPTVLCGGPPWFRYPADATIVSLSRNPDGTLVAYVFVDKESVVEGFENHAAWGTTRSLPVSTACLFDEEEAERLAAEYGI